MNVNIAICDDERHQREYLHKIVSAWSLKSGHGVYIATFDSAEAFLFAFEENKSFDIILLDIQMKELDGVGLAKKLREDDKRMQIVFITGVPDFIAEGYEVSALHYLMKPVKEDKLYEVLDKAVLNLNQKEESLFLTIDGQMHRIPLSKIQYIEAQGHYIVVRTAQEEYRTKLNLSEIQKSLNEGFFRCQRSFIVNLRFVSTITRSAIILNNATQIPISRDLYDAANQALIAFFP